jgi:hypothetical protein
MPPPIALRLYAPPKSGSTFLSHFLAALAEAAGVCHVRSIRYRCAHAVSLACTPRFGGARRCRPYGDGGVRRCSLAVQARRTDRLSGRCCDAVHPYNTSDLLDEPPSSSAHHHGERWLGGCSSTVPERAASARRWLDETPTRWLRIDEHDDVAFRTSAMATGAAPITTAATPTAPTSTSAATSATRGAAAALDARLARALAAVGYVHGPSRVPPSVPICRRSVIRSVHISVDHSLV